MQKIADLGCLKSMFSYVYQIKSENLKKNLKNCSKLKLPKFMISIVSGHNNLLYYNIYVLD
ncbi:hypothetical protein BpHYR1_047216 [Brachionus plicatilis]|uniref:Uncharacterized protein n=1 Tax=Brachionus plicatilis TaxID=10195 RepID=A0A3M7QV00_BRAPC|nr:hypothetical protein BpHYR1_047216 [Brachionus plicatilis]